MHLKRRWFVACELCLVLQVFLFFSSCAKTLRCVFFSLGLCCAAVYQQDLLANGLPDVLCIFFFLQSECSLSLSFSSEPSPACWRQCFPASLSFTRIRVRLRWLNSVSEPVKKKKRPCWFFIKLETLRCFCISSQLKRLQHQTVTSVCCSSSLASLRPELNLQTMFPSNIVAPFPK